MRKSPHVDNQQKISFFLLTFLIETSFDLFLCFVRCHFQIDGEMNCWGREKECLFGWKSKTWSETKRQSKHCHFFFPSCLPSQKTATKLLAVQQLPTRSFEKIWTCSKSLPTYWSSPIEAQEVSITATRRGNFIGLSFSLSPSLPSRRCLITEYQAIVSEKSSKFWRGLCLAEVSKAVVGARQHVTEALNKTCWMQIRSSRLRYKRNSHKVNTERASNFMDSRQGWATFENQKVKRVMRIVSDVK